jgi:DNA replication protein DnaC
MNSEAIKPVAAGAPQTYADTCETHGAYISELIDLGFKSIKKGCPQCNEKRRQDREAEDARRAEVQAQMDAIAATKRLRSAGVPLRFEGKTLDAYLTSTEGQVKAKAACEALVTAMLEGREAPNLIMTGKPGTGKTHLSCGIVLALYGRKKVKRVDLPDLIREIRSTWRKDSEVTEETVLDWYGAIDLLILEEVGTGSGSDDERARIFQVINRRYEAMLPTVVVTNLSLAELREEMGERVIDRLREGERSLVVFDWESSRGAA